MNQPIQAATLAGKKEHVPLVLQTKAIAFLIISFLSFKAVSLLYLESRISIQASDLTIGNILSAVNKERTSRNIAALNSNFMLSSASQSKSDDMVARSYFSHTDPEGNYIWKKIEQAGYTPYSQLGENLAIEFTNTESLVSAWMNSPTHRANILQEGFKDQGAGLTFGNSSAGQYHSAIVNAFGTLITKTGKESVSGNVTQPAPPAPAPAKPAPAKTTTTTRPAPATTTTKGPAQTTTTTPPPPPQTEPIQPRGADAAPDYTLVSQNPAAHQASSAPKTPLPASAPAVVAKAAAQAATNLPHRYIVLGFGVMLLLLLLADLKQVLQSKIDIIDKKVNNLVLLVIALVVIAVMYWL